MKTGDFVWFSGEVILGALVFFFAAKNSTDSTRHPAMVAIVAAVAAMLYVSTRSSYLNTVEYVFSGATGADQELTRTIYRAQGIVMFLAGCAGVLSNRKLKDTRLQTHVEGFEVGNAEFKSKLNDHTAMPQNQSESQSNQKLEALPAMQPSGVATLSGFELLFKEQEGGFRDQPLWLKSLSEADGNEVVAQAKYNRERAALLEAQAVAKRKREADVLAHEAEQMAAVAREKERELNEFFSEVNSDILKSKAWVELPTHLPTKEAIQALKLNLEGSIPRLRIEGCDDVIEAVKGEIENLQTLLELHRKHEITLDEIAFLILDKKMSVVDAKMGELRRRFEDLNYKDGEQILHRSSAFWAITVMSMVVLAIFGVIFVQLEVFSPPIQQKQISEKPNEQASPRVGTLSKPTVSAPLDKNLPPPLNELRQEIAGYLDQMTSSPPIFFSTADLPKALGLIVKGQLPPALMVRDNPNPGGVITAGNTADKFAISVDAITLENNDSLRSRIETGAVNNLIPPKAILVDSKTQQIAGNPALQIDFTSSLVSQGLLVHVFNRYFWIVLNDRILGLHFFTIEDPDNQKARFSIVEPLFDKIIQTITIVQPQNGEKSHETKSEESPQNPTSAKEVDSSVNAFDPTKRAIFKNTLGMKFVPIEQGALWMSIWETRNTDFDAYLLEADGTGFDDSSIGMEDHPVVNLTFGEAVDFTDWLTKKEHESGVLPREFRYRLPTDSEWTVAVGYGTYPWGIRAAPPKSAGNYRGTEAYRANNSGFNVLADMGWSDSYPKTSPVGAFKPNEKGLYDLGGNVWEWCDTEYKPSLNSQEILESFPFLRDKKTASGKVQKVLRGASWRDSDPASLNSSTRLCHPPDSYNDSLGFRVVIAQSR